ncbi:MAG TPA: carbohydrate porin [Vicinamibacterales bacterium]|nr:carbohydrate porin [Vicinamibacterales bacterium]
MKVLAIVLTAAVLLLPGAAHAQTDEPPEPAAIFPHDSDRFWLSGQVNTIFQAHAAFPSSYSGDHSLRADGEHATSIVMTLYTGVRLAGGTEFLFDVESAGGKGISDAFGLAGFTDLDVVRNPTLGASPYIARVMVHQTIALGDGRTAADAGPLSFARSVPVRRIEWRAGKFGTADFFDLNAAGSDSHLQFMNWTVDNNGAYDYAADTRGYTWGAIVEYHDRGWAVRFGEMLMPKVANGIDMDWDVARARAENLEIEWRPAVLGRPATIRALTYVNHANMGDYREAIQRFESGLERVPTIENTRQQGTVKYGFGLNADQQVTSRLRAFARAGWNEPHHESFAYTEVNNSFALGVDYSGDSWRRPQDRVAVAAASNGLSDDHARYLALGGEGFLLGDGALTYRREEILEAYYNARLWRGVFAAADIQRIANPGYNADRGPVSVFSLRLHVDF